MDDSALLNVSSDKSVVIWEKREEWLSSSYKIKKTVEERTVADPGFPSWAPTPKVKSYYFANFSPKPARKWKKSDQVEVGVRQWRIMSKAVQTHFCRDCNGYCRHIWAVPVLFMLHERGTSRVPLELVFKYFIDVGTWLELWGFIYSQTLVYCLFIENRSILWKGLSVYIYLQVYSSFSEMKFCRICQRLADLLYITNFYGHH